MNMLKTALAAIALLSGPAVAQEATSLQSDWIELVKGHKGATLGLELRDIQPRDSQGMQTVTLAVPKSAVSHPDVIEEVLVTAQAPEQRAELPPLKIQYRWLDDYDEDHYGLEIQLGEGNWPIRLFLNSSAGFLDAQ